MFPGISTAPSLLVSESRDNVDTHPKASQDKEKAAAVKEMLNQLRNGSTPHDDSEETPTDQKLNQMNYLDFLKLRRAMVRLNLLAKDKKLDVFLHAHVLGMAGALNLYLNSRLSYSWCETSIITAKAHGAYCALYPQWIHQFLVNGKLPHHSYAGTQSTILEDEDISLQIQMELAEHSKTSYIKACDVVKVVAGSRVQQMLTDARITKQSISEKTGCMWLKRFK